MTELDSVSSSRTPFAPQIILLGSIFTVAACGLVYELVAAAVSSYLMGDAVTQFSLVIGTFLCAMGVGSYIAKFITRRLIETFVELEIWIGLLGGASSILMFAINAFAESLFTLFFYSLCTAIGILVGLEIPLLVRILKSSGGFSEAISNVLAIDYIGALAGSLLFPLVALPFLGLSRTSVVFGLLNLGVAAAGTTLLSGAKFAVRLRLGIAFMVLISLFLTSGRLVGFLEDLLYQDSIVYCRTTTYQRIVITRWQNDIRLFLNGHIQFSSIDEERYHEALVIPAMEAAARKRQVLILGGGDGLAAREVLSYPSVENIVLVDLDPVMTELARTRPELLALNRNALNDAKVEIVNADAMAFLSEDQRFFDIILIDLPDPNTPALAKLYSRSFYAMVNRRLTAGGVMVTQATSPFFATDAFWCIHDTINENAGNEVANPLIAVPYHVHVPSFGEWGFVLAARHRIDPKDLQISRPAEFLNNEVMQAIFAFGSDIAPRPVEINRLDDPVLHRYYEQGWQRYNE